MAFDELHFDQEGLKVTGSNGVLMLDYYRGEPGDSSSTRQLKFQLSPPRDAINQYYSVLKYFKNRSVRTSSSTPST